MIDVYYEGDFGDLGNADWFHSDGRRIKDVTGIGNVRVGIGVVTLTIDTTSGLLDCKIVRQPGTIRHTPIDQRKVLYEIRLERSRDEGLQRDIYQMEVIPHEDDGYGFRRPDRSKMLVTRQEIDGYTLAQAKDPVQLATEVVRELGRRMGSRLATDLLVGIKSSKPIVASPPYEFEKAYADLDPSEFTHYSKIEEDERTEGDDLLDFFKSRN